MDLDFKLRFGVLFKYFAQHKALCPYFAVIPEIPQTAHFQFRAILTSSGLNGGKFGLSYSNVSLHQSILLHFFWDTRY